MPALPISVQTRKTPVGALCLLAISAMGLIGQNVPSPPVVSVPRRLPLKDAESLLLQRNLAIAVNRQQLEAAEAAKLIASYKPNPTIQLGAEQIAIASPVPGGAPRFFATNADAGANSVYTFLFTKVIERGGKREFRTKQAEAQAGAAKAQILDTFRLQLFQLRQAYGAAILSRKILELARQTLKEYDQTERLTEIRVQAGDASQFELYRVRSGKLPYQQGLLQAESSYRQACLDVLNLLNSRREDVVIEPVGPTDSDEPSGSALSLGGDFVEKTPLVLLDELKRTGLQERPDIELARRTRQAAQFGTQLAEAQRKRDLSIGTEYQRVGDDSSLGVVASFPLFLYNNQKAGIVQARALERSGDLQLRQVELQAITDIEKAWERFRAAQQSLTVFSADNLRQTEKLREVAFFSYQLGATSLFELLDAQRTLLQARTGHAQARFDLQVSLWMLEAATGRDLP